MSKGTAGPRRVLDVPKFGCLNCGYKETQALLDKRGGIYTKCSFCHRLNLGINPQLLAVFRFLGEMLTGDDPSFRDAWQRVRLAQVTSLSEVPSVPKSVPADASTPVVQQKTTGVSTPEENRP